MNNTIRCFIAIELSEEIKNTLAKIESELQRNIQGVKWVNPDNIHLTLKFLGQIEKEAIEEIKKILDEITATARPFKIRLSQIGAFPNPNQPRVIWVGIDDGTKESSHLANLIEEKIVPLGIEKEDRAFHPHLTLARIKFLKDKSSVKNAFASLKVPQVEMTAAKIALFQSTLTPEGPIYTVLETADFKK